MIQQRSSRILISLALAVLALAGCQRRPQERAARFLNHGKMFAQIHDHARAILEFKNASKAMPLAAEPLYQMADSYLALENGLDAVGALNEAIRLDSGHLPAQLKLVGLMISTGQKEILQQAEERMNELAARFPENADVLQTRASVRLGLGKLAEAEEDARQALDKQPMHPRAILTLALLKLGRNDFDAAEQLLKESFGHDQKSAETATSLGKLYLLTGKLADAQRWFHTALELDKQFAPALLGLGATEMRLGHQQAAGDAYQRASELPSKSLKLAHAWFLANTGQTSAARAELERLMRQDPKNRVVRTQLVAAYIQSNRQADAAKILDRALDENPRDTDALLERGQLHLESGKLAEAQADLHTALGYLPKSAKAHYLLACTYQSYSQIANLERELNETLQLDPAFLAARVDLGKLLLTSNRARAALDLVNLAPASQNQALPLVLIRNWAWLALGELVEARNSINAELSKARLPELLIQDGILKRSQGNYAAARASFEAALQQSAEDLRAIDGIAGSYLAEKQPAKALARIRQTAALHPESGPIQRYLGEVLLRMNDIEGSRGALAAAKAADPKDRAVDMDLARLEIAAGDFAAARQRLMMLAAGASEDSAPLLMLGMLEERTGSSEKATEWYRKALKVNSTNIVALNNLAYRLSENANTIDEALGYGQRAKELAQDSSPAIDDTLGWIYYRKRLYQTALKYLEAAAEREPTARRKYHLAMTYSALGSQQMAKQTIAEALTLDPSMAEAQQARRQILASAGPNE